MFSGLLQGVVRLLDALGAYHQLEIPSQRGPVRAATWPRLLGAEMFTASHPDHAISRKELVVGFCGRNIRGLHM